MSEQELDIDNILSDMDDEQDEEKQSDESSQEHDKAVGEDKAEEAKTESSDAEAGESKPKKRPANDKPNNRWEQLLQERRLAREEASEWAEKHTQAQKEVLSLNTQISSLKQQITQYDDVLKQIMAQLGGDASEVDIKSLISGAKQPEAAKSVDPEEIRKSVLQEIEQGNQVKEKVKNTVNAWEKHIKRVQNEFTPNSKALFQDAFQYFSSKVDKNVGILDTLEYVGSLEFAPETLYAIAQDKVFQSAKTPFEQIRRVNAINQQITSKKAKVTKSESLPNGGGKAAVKQSGEHDSFADYRKKKYGG